LTLGGSNQSISGSTTFNNLIKTVSAADTLTFQANATQTVEGALILQGAREICCDCKAARPASSGVSIRRARGRSHTSMYPTRTTSTPQQSTQSEPTAPTTEIIQTGCSPS